MTTLSGQAKPKSLLGPVGEIEECTPAPEHVTDLWASSGLYLKSVAKISITVAIPFVKGKEGSRIVSNSEVMANIKKLVTPREFKSLKIFKETNTFLRYLGEIEEKKDVPTFVAKLNGSFIQLKSFGTDAVFKLNAAEFDIITPKQKDWEMHFSKMIGSDEDKPGMRPDTILLSGIPCAWFSNYHRDKQRALKEFQRERETRKKRKMMKNRRRLRGSPVSSSSHDSDKDVGSSSSTDSAEEEAERKREQQKKILLQFQTGQYNNSEEGKNFLHTKDEIHQIYRVSEKDQQNEKEQRKAERKSRRKTSRRSSRSRSSRSRSESSRSGSRSSSNSSTGSDSSYSSTRSDKKNNSNNIIRNKKKAEGGWKTNAFTTVQNGEFVENGTEKEKENICEKTELDVQPKISKEKDDKRLNEEAVKVARRQFRKRPWLNVPVPDRPEESMVHRVFELYGRIRKIEIPLLKELADQSSKYKRRKRDARGIGVFNFDLFEYQRDAADVTTFKTFDVYIQYENYLGFTVAMGALRGKRLYYKDLDDRTYLNTFKVDFDGTGYLSDRKIQQRKIERFKHIHKDEILVDKERLSTSRLNRENKLAGQTHSTYSDEFFSRVKTIRNKSASKASRKRQGTEDSNYRSETESKRRYRRQRVAFPMPNDKILPKSVLYETSQSRARDIKSVSSSFGPLLPGKKPSSISLANQLERQKLEQNVASSSSPKHAESSRNVKQPSVSPEDKNSRQKSVLTELDQISSEEDTPGLQSNTEIDRLLKEALKVKSARKRRLVVLELLRRLQMAKEARVYLVAKRKAQATILIHAIFERIKNLQTAVLDRRVEVLEELRLKQVEQEKALKEEMFRKEAMEAYKQHQKMQTKEDRMREKIVKRTMRKNDLADLEKREQLRKQVAATMANTSGDNPILKSTALREARQSVRRHGFKPDMVGHEVDKVVGSTAPEAYSHYVEYMKQQRPNFIGSTIVTSFTTSTEETPMRADGVRSCVVPTQCPVPKPLEEVIKSKQFETDSESSCEEPEPPPPSMSQADRDRINREQRRKQIDLDDDSLYRVGDLPSTNSAITPLTSKVVALPKSYRATRTFTDDDFKVPEIPPLPRAKQPVKRQWRNRESLRKKSRESSASTKRSSSSRSSSSSSSSSSLEEGEASELSSGEIDDDGDNIQTAPSNFIQKPNSPTPNDSLEAAFDKEMSGENSVFSAATESVNNGGSILSEDVLTNIDDSTPFPVKRRNAVEDSIMAGILPQNMPTSSVDSQSDDENDKQGKLTSSEEEDSSGDDSSSDSEAASDTNPEDNKTEQSIDLVCTNKVYSDDLDQKDPELEPTKALDNPQSSTLDEQNMASEKQLIVSTDGTTFVTPQSSELTSDAVNTESIHKLLVPHTEQLSLCSANEKSEMQQSEPPSTAGNRTDNIVEETAELGRNVAEGVAVQLSESESGSGSGSESGSESGSGSGSESESGESSSEDDIDETGNDNNQTNN